MAEEKHAVDPGRLARFAEAEFFHSLGSYGKAIEVLRSVGNDPDEEPDEDPRGRTRNLSEMVALALRHNEALREDRDKPPGKARHPEPPDAMELSYDWAPRIDRFYRAGEKALKYLLEARGEAIRAEPGGSEQPPEPLLQLGRCLYWEQDPASSAKKTNEAFGPYLTKIAETKKGKRVAPADRHIERRVKAKLARFGHRREGIRGVFPLDAIEEGSAATERYVKLLLDAHLGGSGRNHERSAMFVLDCLIAGHCRLHMVEYKLAQPFKQAVEMHKGGRGKAKQLLYEAEVLHTFVFVACRSFPWIFASDKAERDRLLEAMGADPPKRGEAHALPAARAARRFSFLALSRRAFGYALIDRLEQGTSNHLAFKDFHKLQRLLRAERRSLDGASPRPDGAEPGSGGALSERAFIDGMVALAETHIGELYRSDHAHPLALRHFCDAYDRLELLSQDLQCDMEPETDEEGEEVVQPDVEAGMEPWLRESRWRIRLLISKGKGFYEVGNLKRSIKWMVRSWRALLYLSAGPDTAEIATAKEHCTRLIRALGAIRNDPDFSKSELEDLIAPVVHSATTIELPERVRALASEILLRLGHTIFVIKLVGDGTDDDLTPGSNPLAYACLRRAAFFDPTNILIEADLLKIELEQEEQGRAAGTAGSAGTELTGEEGDGVGQWPFGRGEAEQTIRMIEYLLLRRLRASAPADPQPDLADDGGEPRDAAIVDRAIARALIRQFLTHTDSINVKQSQVYRYLMRPRRDSGSGMRELDPPLGQSKRKPSIEFICLRRYSSFFPFVPRPSAFRALGGGYFVRLHDTRDLPGASYGIAIDPGPDFIGNLYRCGFSLSDIDMVVVTHDHADHAASIDPLLSLLGYRLRFGDRTYVGPKRQPEQEGGGLRGPKAYGEAHRLLIVGNESVARRLDFFNPPHMTAPNEPRRDAVRVMSFDEFAAFQAADESADLRKRADFEVPSDLRLTPVPSTRHRDGYGFLAYGMRISVADGPSIGFTGDTGGFRFNKRSDGMWEAEFDEHEEAGLKRIGAEDWQDHWRPLLTADVLVAHMSATPFTQLQAVADGGIDTDTEAWKAFQQDREKFLETWDYISDDVKHPVNFAFWLEDSHRKTRPPLRKIPADFKWPADHLYFGGLLSFARAYKKQHEGHRKNHRGLFLVGELREELGTFRSKVALNLDKHIFQGTDGPDGLQNCRALTADVGLRLSIESDPEEPRDSVVRVLCSACDLDNDRPEGERYHHPSEIYEVCVKGENEGIFYNCFGHDPSRHSEPVFLERVERYDIFASELFR